MLTIQSRYSAKTNGLNCYAKSPAFVLILNSILNSFYINVPVSNLSTNFS